MEVTKEMNVSVEYLFDVFKKSIQADILNHTGQEVSEDEFTDFKYIKKFSENNQATIHIDKYIKYESYHYSTHTDKNSILAKYDVTPINENTCRLVYTEQINSHGFLQKLNDTMVGIIWGFLKKRKFNEMLNQIEDEYTRRTE